MSVIHKPDKPDKTAELQAEVIELQAEVAKMKAAAATTDQIAGFAFRSAIVSDRATGANKISDAAILSAASVATYPEWKPEQDYIKGEILQGGGGLYFEVIAAHKSNTAYPISTTFAYYRLVELAHSGTLADPIPYPEQAGIVVNVKKGLFYSYKGSTYKAVADMPNCVYPPDTPSLWQWEKQTAKAVKAARAAQTK